MKKLTKSLISLLIAALLLSSSLAALFPASAATLVYSQTENSGERDEICTTLDGTSAAAYYTGSYRYETLVSQSATTLLNSLRTLMRSTHKKISSYNDCRDMATKTDCENENGKITMLYTSYQATYGQYQSGNGWNREHVWPKSLGGDNTSGGGADLHHIRPDENKTNSNRGNKKFGNVSGGSTSTGNLSGEVGGRYSGNYFEPNDNVKGDVARIILYVYVRWYTEWGAESVTEVFQSIDVLLEWHKNDPVDTWEMGRNEVVAAYQGNRNVFIDYPEFAFLIFGEDVPDDMITPSGNQTPTTKPVTTTAPVTTAKPTVTEKPSDTPTTPTRAPLTSGSVSLYAKASRGSDADSLLLVYVIDRDLLADYQDALTLTVVFSLGGGTNTERYSLSELTLADGFTALGETYAAKEGCILLGKAIDGLAKGSITQAKAVLSDGYGVVLSQFTLQFS